MESKIKERTLAKMTGKQNSYRVDLSMSMSKIQWNFPIRISMARVCQLGNTGPIFANLTGQLVQIGGMGFILHISSIRQIIVTYQRSVNFKMSFWCHQFDQKNQ